MRSRSRKLYGGATAALATAGLAVALAMPVTADERLVGSYQVTGTDTEKGAYDGRVDVSQGADGALRVRGRYEFERGRDHRFDATATSANGGIAFSVRVERRGGFFALLARIFGGGSRDADEGHTFNASYAAGEEPGQLAGTWTVDGATRRTDAWQKAVLRIDSVSPVEISAGRENQPVTITGRSLPSGPGSADIAFLRADGQVDGAITVRGVRPGNDDRTELTLFVDVDRRATLGPRGLRVRDKNADVEADGVAERANAVNVIPPPPRLRLGRETPAVQAGRVHDIFVPLGKGTLTFSAAVSLTAPNGDAVEAAEGGGYAIAEPGTYKVTPAAAGVLSNGYVLEAECLPENKPWHFWYFPYAIRSRAGLNLWSDGGALEKLDRALGIEHAENAPEFDASRHIDRDEFEMPEDEAEAAKYVTDTIRGYAYCYQRSLDPSKGWWGHCWGAVVASSIYRQPEAAEIEGESFSQEEAEGILSCWFTDQSVFPRSWLRDCPAARPTDEQGEECDRYADDVLVGLLEGIGDEGLAIASNLRAELTDETPEAMNQVWNHIIYAYRAEVREIEDANDPLALEVDLRIEATNDIYPSPPSSSARFETWVLRVGAKPEGGIERDADVQNWVSASHYTPSYLWKISTTAGTSGTKNRVLVDRVGLDKLVDMFGYKKYGED